MIVAGQLFLLRLVGLSLRGVAGLLFPGRLCGGATSVCQRTPDAQRLAWLTVSLATNLGLLGFFKYSGFLGGSLNDVLAWTRYGGRLPVPEIILPVGISFYTFQTLSYTIDIFRKKARPADSFWHFAAYVSLFPQLIAGPIVRYTDLEDQLRQSD